MSLVWKVEKGNLPLDLHLYKIFVIKKGGPTHFLLAGLVLTYNNV